MAGSTTRVAVVVTCGCSVDGPGTVESPGTVEGLGTVEGPGTVGGPGAGAVLRSVRRRACRAASSRIQDAGDEDRPEILVTGDCGGAAIPSEIAIC